jgi:glucose/mannose-6-phosphate isomerase
MAIEHGCQIAVIATGGKLADIATEHEIMLAKIPHDTQPRMAVLYNLRALLRVLHTYSLVDTALYNEMASAKDWLRAESELWASDKPTELNYAKQLALVAVGKTPVFYGGSLMAPLAYKWKISWNENAKNVAFWNYLPEFNHNEFIGWTSHPVEKPFAVFDLVSELEHPRIQKRFALSDRLLSGLRPKSTVIPVQGDSVLKQLLWGSILADFVSIYVAILNNVDPTRVDLIEKFKVELG